MIFLLQFLVYQIKKMYPHLGEYILKSNLGITLDKHIKKSLINSVFLSLVLTFLLFLLFSKIGISLILLIPIFIIFIFGILIFLIRIPMVYVRKKEKDINKNILFATRYLLVKIESGEPLLNAMEKISSGYGTTSEIFRGIVNNISMGNTLENAIDKGVERSSSDNLTRILWEISNSLKVGIDISKPLRSMIDQITQEQLIEIERYTKRLNSITLFYMVLAVVVPSLGMTMFVVISSFLRLEINMTILIIIAFFLAFFQFMFVSIFQSLRPSVEL